MHFGPAKDRVLLLTFTLADAINLGLNKMAEACPGTSIAKLSWLSAWHIRDETYSKALATLVNHQHRQTFASHWVRTALRHLMVSAFSPAVAAKKPAKLILVTAAVSTACCCAPKRSDGGLLDPTAVG
jgi:TnpA family transposase